MAKKAQASVGGKKKNIFDLMKSVDESTEILSESKTSTIREYIDTGNYMLNACMTGSIFKGVPSGRVTTLASPSGCGKSFLAVSICRNAQKMGYYPFYIDSESAIDSEFVKRLGCDPSNMAIISANTVSQVITYILKLCDQLKSQPEDERDKVIIVLDSLSNLSSDKEVKDSLENNQKRDMTRAQDIKKLFRTIVSPLGKLGIPMICTAHVYQTMDLFSRQVVSGGTGIVYAGSLTLMLSAAKLDDKGSDNLVSKKVGDYTKTGIIVTATPQKSRFTIPQKVQFQIPFFKAPNPYVGLEKYLTWENSGIMRGDLYTEKEYAKMSDADKKDCFEMKDENGNLCYAKQKDTARTIVVKHLGKKVPISELFTSTVLTDELLHKLDEEVIRPNFELPSSESMADVEEMLEE